MNSASYNTSCNGEMRWDEDGDGADDGDDVDDDLDDARDDGDDDDDERPRVNCFFLLKVTVTLSFESWSESFCDDDDDDDHDGHHHE